MKISGSQEEYLKTIYVLSKICDKVRVTDIAKKQDKTKASVNKAINNLKDLELIDYKTYGSIKLTNLGEKLAKEILKRQDILKMFLTEILGISEEQAEKEAINMKHAISKQTEEKLDSYITKTLNLEELKCGYNSDNERCRSCLRIKKRNKINTKI